jgi:hypothetical protein
MPLSHKRTGNIAFAGSIHCVPSFASVFWIAVFGFLFPKIPQPDAIRKLLTVTAKVPQGPPHGGIDQTDANKSLWVESEVRRLANRQELDAYFVQIDAPRG